MSKNEAAVAVDIQSSEGGFPLKKGTNLVAACEKGGTGKSFFVQALVARCEATGVPPQILEFDEGARMQLLYGPERCSFFKLSPKSFKQYERNPQLLYGMWDDAMGVAREAKGVVCWDLGANATKPLCDYLIEQNGRGYLGLGGNTMVFGVTNGDPAAFKAVQQSLGYFGQALPEARKVLVINDIDANFQIDRDAEAIKKVVDHLKCPWGYVERVRAEVLGRAFDKNMSLSAMALKNTDWWVKEFSLPEDAAIRTSARIESFLIDAANILEAARK